MLNYFIGEFLMKKRKNKKSNKLKTTIRVVIVVSLVIGISLYMSEIARHNRKAEIIPYTEFIEKVEAQEIEKIGLNLSKDSTLVAFGVSGEIFITDNPKYQGFKLEMLENGVKVVEKTSIDVASWLLTFAILGTCLFSVFNLNSRTKANVSSVGTGAQSKSKLTFNDVAGHKEVKEDLQLIVEFLKNPEKFKEHGAELPKGALLTGSPGTGKTLLAKAVAGEAGVPFFSINGSDFMEMFVGVGAKRVREIFEKAKKSAPCIIFIDEIDAIGGKRNANNGNSEQRQTINALLAEMDGFNPDDSKGIFVMAATNRIEDLDSALIRPGRFDKHINVPIPQTPEERLEIFNLYRKNRKFNDDVDFNVLAKETIGFSPADIKTLINEATLVSISQNKPNIDKECFDTAYFNKIMKGHARKSKQSNRDEEELKLVAWHEAGHALMARLSGLEVPKVTILSSTSGAGGVTFITPKKLGLKTIEEMKNDVKVSYAGRIAELLLYKDPNKVTTGASSDIEHATAIIYDMIARFGMTDTYGMLNLNILNIDNKEFLEKATEMAGALEKETYLILNSHFNTLEQIANELLEKETITGEELEHIISSTTSNS